MSPKNPLTITLALVAIFILTACSSVSFAQSSAPLYANATIVNPVSMAKVSDLQIINAPLGYTNQESSSLSRQAGHNTAGEAASNVIAASFTVSGYANYTYGVSVPASITISAGAHSITIGTSLNSSIHTLSDSGTDALKVEGTISASAEGAIVMNNKADHFPVTVIYN